MKRAIIKLLDEVDERDLVLVYRIVKAYTKRR